MAETIARSLERLILQDFKDIDAVFINGARQAGKSTFVEIFAKYYDETHYFTFDDISVSAVEINSIGKHFKI